MEFSDAGGKLKSGAATQWNNRFNQEGFSQYNHIGSVRDYFRGSFRDMVSFFAREEKLSSDDLKEIIQEIESNGVK